MTRHTDPDRHALHQANRRAWNVTAARYASEVDDDVAALRAGKVSLFAYELPHLRDLAGWCRHAIHLQCSHGQDALSLLLLGAREVVGVDISEHMLSLAQQKSSKLGAPARWVHADVLDLPADLDGTADLVYTGRGALPWIMDLAAWSTTVARLLRPGGRLLLTEGHPLDWVWGQEETTFRIDPDRGGYFATTPLTNRTFPFRAIARFTPAHEVPPPAHERQWTLAQVVTAVVDAGLVLERLEEHPEPYWGAFPRIPPETVALLPHVYVLRASRPIG